MNHPSAFPRKSHGCRSNQQLQLSKQSDTTTPWPPNQEKCFSFSPSCFFMLGGRKETTPCCSTLASSSLGLSHGSLYFPSKHLRHSPCMGQTGDVQKQPGNMAVGPKPCTPEHQNGWPLARSKAQGLGGLCLRVGLVEDPLQANARRLEALFHPCGRAVRIFGSDPRRGFEGSRGEGGRLGSDQMAGQDTTSELISGTPLAFQMKRSSAH